MIKIKGANWLSSKEYVVKEFGDAGFKKVLDSLSDEDRKVLGKDVVLPHEWIAFDAWIHFYEGVVRELSGGDQSILEKIGEFNAEREMKTLYKIFLKVASPEYVVKNCPLIFNLYFSSDPKGEIGLKVNKIDKKKYALVFEGFQQQHWPFQLGVGAWLKKLFILSGAQGLEITLTKSVAEGSQDFEYTLSWE